MVHLSLEVLLGFRVAVSDEDTGKVADAGWSANGVSGGRGEGGGVNIDGRIVGSKERGRWPKPTGTAVVSGVGCERRRHTNLEGERESASVRLQGRGEVVS